MIRVFSVLKGCEKLSKNFRTAAVFGWTGSFSRNANLVKRFISEQNFFKKKVVLPAITEIVLVQESRPWSADQVSKPRPLLINNSSPKSKFGIRVLLPLEDELM